MGFLERKTCNRTCMRVWMRGKTGHPHHKSNALEFQPVMLRGFEFPTREEALQDSRKSILAIVRGAMDVPECPSDGSSRFGAVRVICKGHPEFRELAALYANNYPTRTGYVYSY